MTNEHSDARSGATVLGWPRQGPRRELKKAIESYWAGRLTADGLHDTARRLRTEAWDVLVGNGIDEVPTGDFSYYDHVLDAAVMVGAVPDRYRTLGPDPLDVYFAMARGAGDVAPLEMTKWFDTNYHYLVPELSPRTEFAAEPAKHLEQFAEATAAGHRARPVLLGPVSFLLLSKPAADAPEDFDPLTLLDALVPVYVEILQQLRAAGAEWVQVDEPCLVLDQPGPVLDAAAATLRTLGEAPKRPKLLIATYFGALGAAFDVLADAPVEGVAIDCTIESNVRDIAGRGLPGKRLLAGVIDGRNIWAADLDAAVRTVQRLQGQADRVDVSSSCSLLHVPLDASKETGIDPELRSWLAFAHEKTVELTTVQTALSDPQAAESRLQQAREVRRSRATSTRTNSAAVRDRLAGIDRSDTARTTDFDRRRTVQQQALGAATADHDDRVLPADPATARCPRGISSWRDRPSDIRAGDARRDPHGDRRAGATGPGCAGTR